jgi:ferredoxin
MRLRVNRIDCAAHGLCAEMLPEWIRLDERGYPILNDPDLPLELVEPARRATAHCPVLALWLDPENV